TPGVPPNRLDSSHFALMACIGVPIREGSDTQVDNEGIPAFMHRNVVVRRGRQVTRLLILLVLSLAGSARCLDPHKSISEYVHNVWRSEDGLPQNSIQALLQTRDGYLWIGTQEGLVRFNGVEFKVFNKSNTDGMRHNDVRVLYEDREGILWVGTFGGGLVRYHDGQFKTYTSQDGL